MYPRDVEVTGRISGCPEKAYASEHNIQTTIITANCIFQIIFPFNHFHLEQTRAKEMYDALKWLAVVVFAHTAAAFQLGAVLPSGVYGSRTRAYRGTSVCGRRAFGVSLVLMYTIFFISVHRNFVY